MTPNKTYSTRQACQLAEFNMDALNCDIHDGLFTIAPPTKAGKAREFTDQQVVLLYIYSSFRERMKPKTASRLIELVDQALSNNPKLEFVVVDCGVFSIEVKVLAAQAAIRERVRTLRDPKISFL